MKAGALDFLAKPVDPDHLLLLVDRALAQRRLVTDYALLKEELAQRRGAPTIIGEAAVMKVVSQAIQRAAGTDTTVLLEGESGTGKELFARAVHALQLARQWSVCGDQLRPPYRRTCSRRNSLATPARGLYGRKHPAEAREIRSGQPRHVVSRRDWRAPAGASGQDSAGARGADLRAARRHRLVSKWTCAWSPRPTAWFEKSGRGAPVSARISTSGCRFFPSPFHRCATGPKDIPILTRHFIERGCRELGNKLLTARARGTRSHSAQYQWPGNVRELQYCLERAVILVDGDTIYPKHFNLTSELRVGPAEETLANIDLSGTLADVTTRALEAVERQVIAHALRDGNGDVARAADRLQLGFKQLTQKIRQYGL